MISRNERRRERLARRDGWACHFCERVLLFGVYGSPASPTVEHLDRTRRDFHDDANQVLSCHACVTERRASERMAKAVVPAADTRACTPTGSSPSSRSNSSASSTPLSAPGTAQSAPDSSAGSSRRFACVRATNDGPRNNG